MLIKRRDHPSSSLSSDSSLLQRIYASRGIIHESQLDYGLNALLPFNTLMNIDKACIRLEHALGAQERILVIGDFDADGATSTAVAISALRSMGAQQVEFLVPNRFEFGYGLTPGIVEIAKKWRPHLIITVDNGIASIEGVTVANQAGIDVLVTDHHLPAEVLPDACAIVNPNQVGDCFQSKSIAGVGVIFYLMVALRRHLIEKNWFSSQNIPQPNMAQFLDLVALGTVADVVGLDQNNRILVSQGLARIRQGHCRPGIKALIEIANRDYTRISEKDLGFAIAPRLNAAGRLDDMSLGIDCLLSDSFEKAQELAKHLDELNQERRIIETEMKEQAILGIEKLNKALQAEQSLPSALCLVDSTWHQGVIGILAGRLKERFHRPVVTFAVIDGVELKGSARSVSGINIRDILAAIDKDHPKLITKFGGHAMAAGLSLKFESFDAFQQAFVDEVKKHLDPADCKGEYLTDGPLTPEELMLETALLLKQAGPWGQQFPEPCFDNHFEILDQRIVGKNHLKLTFAHPNKEDIIDAIMFNIDLNQWPNHRAKEVHAGYKLDLNIYQGRTKLQLIVETLHATA